MFFYNPEHLSWIILLGFLLVIYAIQIRLRDIRLKKWLGSKKLFLNSLVSSKKRYAKFILKLLALLFFIIAFARPRVPGSKVQLESSGVYILILADSSLSMLSTDVKPTRLYFMKKELSRFLEKSQGDKIALAAFANSVDRLSPFTQDIGALVSLLEDLDPKHFFSQGTNFAQAFAFAGKAFQAIKTKQRESTTKVLLIASDGEDHSQLSSQETEALNHLLQQKVRIFSLGFGTKKGGAIPILNRRGEVSEYKKDSSGKLVITKLKSKGLKKFAKLGKGAYYHVTYGGDAMDNLRADINQLEKTNFEKLTTINNKEIYYWFLILGLFFAFAELFVSERRFYRKSN